ncbi:hypothetical protein BDP27DRAFT_1326032 [Rhodocollybia butyracea]|uniref:Uncharacterized protein n=1 Tax=Rhodocollybia butyracea TaxID=206335 RepID=A0A9P5PTM9_9AGAR|nr:hypothetical protein BDP27DRAFT_1326032 [Rhodocollybia butyracea]
MRLLRYSNWVVGLHYTYFYQGGNENAEILSQLASGSCNLVYTILIASKEISLPDTTLTEADEKLKQILRIIRPGQQPPALRSFRVLRKLGTTKSDLDITQLQVYKEQWFSMLFTFQVFGAFVKHTESHKEMVQNLSQRVVVLKDRIGSSPPVSPQLSRDNSDNSVNSPMSRPVQPGSTTDRDAFPDDESVSLWFSARVPQTSSTTPPYPAYHNSRNPFLRYIHRRDTSPRVDGGNVVAGASAISPFAPTSQRDVSFRNSHVGGSSSTLSNVDNSIKENFNNITHNHYYLAPYGFPPLPPGSGYGSDTSVYAGFDGGNRELVSAHSGENRNTQSGGYEGRSDYGNYNPYRS